MTKYRKLWAAVVGFVTLILATEVGVDSKWYAYAIAALTAAGVWFFPNEPTDA